MTKIQVIGLPAAGKTKAIQNFLAACDVRPLVIDIRHFSGKRREHQFEKYIREYDGNLIAESACGAWVPTTTVIRLDPPTSEVYARNARRTQAADLEYLSLLRGQMIPADYTIASWLELTELLTTLFRGSLHV